MACGAESCSIFQAVTVLQEALIIDTSAGNITVVVFKWKPGKEVLTGGGGGGGREGGGGKGGGGEGRGFAVHHLKKVEISYEGREMVLLES